MDRSAPRPATLIGYSSDDPQIAAAARCRTTREAPAVTKEPEEHHAAGELLADWRAAERDAVAARDAAHIAALALAAAEAAEEAATEVEAAAEAASEAVERARSAAGRARRAAAQAAEAATSALTSAQGDQVRARQSVTEAEVAEDKARDLFHEAESKGFPKD